jgi:hypothetical protein
MLTGGVQVSARVRGRGSHRFGVLARWATGSFRDWAESVPLGPFVFLFRFLLFLF